MSYTTPTKRKSPYTPETLHPLGHSLMTLYTPYTPETLLHTIPAALVEQGETLRDLCFRQVL